MTLIQKQNRRNKFLKHYANLPLGARAREIVAVVKGRNLTYQDICGFIKDGELADQALEQMDRLEIL
jgi:hypothetical protein